MDGFELLVLVEIGCNFLQALKAIYKNYSTIYLAYTANCLIVCYHLVPDPNKNDANAAIVS